MVTAGCANAAEQSAAARIESVSVRVPTVLLQCARGKHNIDLPECVLMSMRIGCGEVKVHPTDALRDRENDAELDPKVGGMGRRMSGRRIPLRPPLAFRWPCADPRTALLSLRFQWVTVYRFFTCSGKTEYPSGGGYSPSSSSNRLRRYRLGICRGPVSTSMSQHVPCKYSVSVSSKACRA